MKNICCFLIDDDLDDQELFSMVLEAMNPPVKCRQAKDALDGIKILKDESSYFPDYIFIDLNMPKIGGLQCLAEIRKISRLKDSRIYLFSTSADPKIIVESKDLGAEDFMIKPARLEELERALSDIIKG